MTGEYIWLLNNTCRCVDNMEKHLKQSVLSKLPEGYKDILRQSAASEVDDMGMISTSVTIKLYSIYLNCLHNSDYLYASLVPEPKLDTFVICRSKGDLRPFELPDRYCYKNHWFSLFLEKLCKTSGLIFSLHNSDGVPLELLAGDLHVLQYKSIKLLVESGDVELV